MARCDEIREFLRYADAEKDEILSERAEDLGRVDSLVGAMGQSFTTTIFAFQQVSTVKSDVAFLLKFAGGNENVSIEVARLVASNLLANPVNTLRKRYKLVDTADLFEKASQLAGGAASKDELVTILRSLLEYLDFLARRIRVRLPFHELSVVFEGMKRLAAAKAR